MPRPIGIPPEKTAKTAPTLPPRERLTWGDEEETVDFVEELDEPPANKVFRWGLLLALFLLGLVIAALGLFLFFSR